MSIHTPTTTRPRATAKPLAKRTARDVMTPDPETTTPDASLFTAASQLAELGVRHLPVVDDNGRLIGMLSDRDVRNALGDPREALRNRDQVEITVGDAMRPDPVTAEMDTLISELAEVLADEHIGAIPIVDEGGHPIGIVSYVDLLACLSRKTR